MEAIVSTGQRHLHVPHYFEIQSRRQQPLKRCDDGVRIVTSVPHRTIAWYCTVLSHVKRTVSRIQKLKENFSLLGERYFGNRVEQMPISSHQHVDLILPPFSPSLVWRKDLTAGYKWGMSTARSRLEAGHNYLRLSKQSRFRRTSYFVVVVEVSSRPSQFE